MSFGQYSRGSTRHTKADMIETAALAATDATPITFNQKAGHNRLHFGRADGSQHFMLHQTVIASLSGDRAKLTLNNGGWATMTTHRAMGDALEAFGIRANSPSASRGQTSAFGHLFDREATFTLPDFMPVDLGASLVIVRATSESGTYGELEVTYDGSFVRSRGAGVVVAVKPRRAILALRTISQEAKDGKDFRGGQYDNMDLSRDVKVLGDFPVSSGRFGRTVHIGCHEFKTVDLRAALRRIEADHPEAKRAADTLTRKMRHRAKRALRAS